MKLVAGALTAVAVALTWGSAAAAAESAAQTCDVRINVMDRDPKGLNVRDAPSLTVGKVIGALKGDWVQVHVTGQSGGWMSIDDATLYDDENPDKDDTSIFKGRGWVSSSKLGFDSWIGGGAVILSAPHEGATKLKVIRSSEFVGAPPQVIGCSGEYLQVRIGALVGWTNSFCSNERTTCV